MFKYIGLVLLALWLIVQGAGHLLEFYFPKEQKILPIINMAAGVFLVLCIIKIKRGEIGLLFLGFWAVLQSSMFLFHFSFNHSNTVVHLLGIIAGILLILKV
ncbi:MAG: hypothetical protein GQ569_14245 [Methylococcaceae bacterium]|nr:hypothetical protein [Methylococcaceae bacterium]